MRFVRQQPICRAVTTIECIARTCDTDAANSLFHSRKLASSITPEGTAANNDIELEKKISQ